MPSYANNLGLSFHLQGQTIRAAIDSLLLTPGSHGLDIGCGIGNISSLLAEAVTPTGTSPVADFLQAFLTSITEGKKVKFSATGMS